MEREGVPALCGRYNGTVPGLYLVCDRDGGTSR